MNVTLAKGKSRIEADGLITVIAYIRFIGMVKIDIFPVDVVKLILTFYINTKSKHKWACNVNINTYLELRGNRGETISISRDNEYSFKSINNNFKGDLCEMVYFWLKDPIKMYGKSRYEYKIKIRCNKNQRTAGKGLDHICISIGIINDKHYFIGWECCPYSKLKSNNKWHDISHKLFETKHTICWSDHVHQGNITNVNDDGKWISNDDELQLIVNTKLKTMELNGNGIKWKYSGLDKWNAWNWNINDYFICFRLKHVNQSITVKNYTCTRL